MSVLPFAEGADQVTLYRFRASYQRAMRNLEWVHQYAEIAQFETRKDLSLQIAALFGELDSLAAEVGMEMAQQRRELEEALNVRQLPAISALGGLRQAIEKLDMDAEGVFHGRRSGTTSGFDEQSFERKWQR